MWIKVQPETRMPNQVFEYRFFLIRSEYYWPVKNICVYMALGHPPIVGAQTHGSALSHWEALAAFALICFGIARVGYQREEKMYG